MSRKSSWADPFSSVLSVISISIALGAPVSRFYNNDCLVLLTYCDSITRFPYGRSSSCEFETIWSDDQKRSVTIQAHMRVYTVFCVPVFSFDYVEHTRKRMLPPPSWERFLHVSKTLLRLNATCLSATSATLQELLAQSEFWMMSEDRGGACWWVCRFGTETQERVWGYESKSVRYAWAAIVSYFLLVIYCCPLQEYYIEDGEICICRNHDTTYLQDVAIREWVHWLSQIYLNAEGGA